MQYPRRQWIAAAFQPSGFTSAGREGVNGLVVGPSSCRATPDAGNECDPSRHRRPICSNRNPFDRRAGIATGKFAAGTRNKRWADPHLASSSETGDAQHSINSARHADAGPFAVFRVESRAEERARSGRRGQKRKDRSWRHAPGSEIKRTRRD